MGLYSLLRSQTDRSFSTRNVELAARMSSILGRVVPGARTGLDIGAQYGAITKLVASRTGTDFIAVDPCIEYSSPTHNGVQLLRGQIESLPFADNGFDVVMMVSVYEHLAPSSRLRGFREVYRVLRPGGALIGQIPNMYFPIEPHSRLPFQSYLPKRLGEWYFKKFSPEAGRPDGVSWFRVGPASLRADSYEAGFRNFWMSGGRYSKEVFPSIASWLEPLTRFIPFNFDFSCRKPLTA